MIEIIYMYDISFIIPFSSNEIKIKNKTINYYDRLKFYKKYGLINVRDVKVKIFALVGNENITDIEKDWNFPCDIEVIRYNHSSATKKINNFYSTLSDIRVNESKWFMQLDDDSITNIYDLFNLINKNFNYNDKQNISNKNPACNVSEYNNIDDYRVFLKAIEETDYKGIINNKNRIKYFYHGYECTIFSQGALKHFISVPSNKKILESDVIFNAVFNGDVLISICANLCGIPLYIVDYLCYEQDFRSLIERKKFHIHYIYKEKNFLFFSKIAKNKLESGK